MFRSSTVVRELVLSLAKVMYKHLCPYRLCGGVAACLGSGVCVVGCAEFLQFWSSNGRLFSKKWTGKGLLGNADRLISYYCPLILWERQNKSRRNVYVGAAVLWDQDSNLRRRCVIEGRKTSFFASWVQTNSTHKELLTGSHLLVFFTRLS
jgi:hypothetical protein